MAVYLVRQNYKNNDLGGGEREVEEKEKPRAYSGYNLRNYKQRSKNQDL